MNPAVAPGIEARQAALTALRKVLEKREALDGAFDGETGTLDQRDRAFARALAATTLRRFGQIEALLGERLQRGFPHQAPALRPILALGAAQILFLSVPDHAAVDSSVRLASLDPHAKHFVPLVNAVLRGLARDGKTAVERSEPRRNIPDWMWRRWSRTFGEADANRIAAAAMVEPPLDLSARDPHGLAAELGGILLPTGSVRLAPEGPITALPGYQDGRWWVQDAAATLPVRLLGAVDGLSVADLCAAPGGKTAQLVVAGARVTAVDRSAVRLIRLSENMQRLGFGVETVIADAGSWQPGNLFDAVLLDAPCTATGTIRRHPDILHTKSEADLARLSALQTRLLRHAVTLVKPGGLIVYAVCSLEPEEGVRQAERLLVSTPEVQRVPVRAEEIGGLDEAITPDGDVRTLPFHLPGSEPRLSGVDGFFAVRFVRSAA